MDHKIHDMKNTGKFGKFGHIYRFPMASGHQNNHIGEAVLV